MLLKDLHPDIRSDVDDAILRLYHEAGLDTYTDLSAMIRLMARDVCRRNGENVSDWREKEFFVKPMNIWDVRRGLDDPVAHVAEGSDTSIVLGLQGVLWNVADTLERFFASVEQDVPESCERMTLLARNRSLRSQIHANGGECSFRVRWDDPQGNAHIAIANIGRHNNETTD